MKNKKNIILAITGASGSIYAKVLLDKLEKLSDQISSVGIVMSDNAKFIWESELGNKNYSNYNFKFYDKQDFMAPFASGSADYTVMIICPCSMGTIGRIASGLSVDLTTRAADVILKERRKLIVVPREAPYSRVHLENMMKITEAGGIICPASPSFYSYPKDFEELAGTIIERVLSLSELKIQKYRWGDNK